MATEWASKFYESTHWKKCRDAFRSYKRGLCEECLKRGVITAGTEVHHKIPLTPANIHNPNITLNWKNLTLLCAPCHHAIHEELKQKADQQKKKGTINHRRYVIDKTGAVTMRPDADDVKVKA